MTQYYDTLDEQTKLHNEFSMTKKRPAGYDHNLYTRLKIARKGGIHMRVTLTRDYRKISASYGLIQNLTPDANIELTENVQSEGIILKPFQTVMINRTIYARKLSGAGVGVLAILPFADAKESSDGETSDDTSETDFTEETAPPLPPKPRPPIPPPHDDDGYVIQIPRELVERGQRKFVVEF